MSSVCHIKGKHSHLAALLYLLGLQDAAEGYLDGSSKHVRSVYRCLSKISLR